MFIKLKSRKLTQDAEGGVILREGLATEPCLEVCLGAQLPKVIPASDRYFANSGSASPLRQQLTHALLNSTSNN